MSVAAVAPGRTAAAGAPAPVRLALGTVQFGMPYGLADPPRMITQDEAREVLELAWAGGIDLLDTAPVYGEAETVVGRSRPAGAAFAVVSKTLPVRRERIERDDIDRVVARVRDSLVRLGVARLYGLLVHEAKDLLVPGADELVRALRALVAEGIVERVGVSVYEPEVLERIAARHPIDMAQVPVNLLDRRFVRDGLVQRLAARGLEIHARSIFLKGLLVRRLDEIPPTVPQAHGPVAAIHRRAADLGMTPAALALMAIVRQPGIRRAVIGIDGPATLRANLDAFALASAATVDVDFAALATDDDFIVDPRRWAP